MTGYRHRRSVTAPALQQIEVTPVAVATTISVPIRLPVGLNDTNGGEIDSYLSLLDGLSTVRLVLEVRDGKAAVLWNTTLRVGGNPNTSNRAELGLKLFLNLLGLQVLRDVLKLNARGIRRLLDLLLLLSGEFGLNSLHVEELFLGCANCSSITSLILVTLVLL